jgi:hypothetical protein
MYSMRSNFPLKSGVTHVYCTDNLKPILTSVLRLATNDAQDSFGRCPVWFYLLPSSLHFLMPTHIYILGESHPRVAAGIKEMQ